MRTRIGKVSFAIVASLLAIVVVLFSLTPEVYARKNKYKRPKSQEAAIDGIDDKKECEKNDHACIINRKVDNIENQIDSMTEGYESGDAWKGLDGNVELSPDRKTKYGLKALRYTANAPNYVFRGITWPFAIFARYLIRKGVIEDLVDFFSNDERTLWIYPLIELGFGSSLGLGVGLRHLDLFHENYKLTLKYQIHLNLDQKALAKFGKPDALMIADRPLSYEVETRFMRYYAGNYYGIGIGAPKSQHSIFSFDNIFWGGNVGYDPIDHMHLEAHTYFSNDWSGHGENGHPSVEATFPMSELPGFEAFLFYFVPGIVAKYDYRDATAAPEKGGYYSLIFNRYQGLNRGQFDYNEYGLDFQQYIRLWAKRHVLVLRTNWLYRHETGGSRVPFYRLTSMDVYDGMRGFASGRYHDRGRMVYNVEYRFPVWTYVDGEIFFDFGRVYHSPSDISFKHIKSDGGVGLRLRTSNFFLARFQVAYGDDGLRVLFKTSQSF